MLSKKYKVYITIVVLLFLSIFSYIYMINKKNEAYTSKKRYYELFTLISNIEKYKPKSENVKFNFCLKQKNKLICKNLNKRNFQIIQNKIFNSNIYIKSFDIKSNKKYVDFVVELK